MIHGSCQLRKETRRAALLRIFILMQYSKKKTRLFNSGSRKMKNAAVKECAARHQCLREGASLLIQNK